MLKDKQTSSKKFHHSNNELHLHDFVNDRRMFPKIRIILHEFQNHCNDY